MKKPILLLGSLACLFAIFWIPLKKSIHTSYENVSKEFEEENEEEEKETGVAGQMMSWFTARAYPDPSYLNDKFLNGWAQASELKRRTELNARKARITTSSWTSIGPSQSVGGRILSIAIDPNNSNNLFIGSASGGIWKTTDGGTSWASVNTDLPVLGIPAITYHPTNSSILVAGTGEVYRTSLSNIGYNVWKARGTYGIGIIRSTDGGATWTNVFNKSFSDLFGVLKIKFDPNNSNIVYACTTTGVYKSTDAGATWNATPVLNKIYVSDIAINPSNSDIMVAAIGNLVDSDKGIYRTTNGGSSWTKIASALPASFSGFITFAGSSPLYASIGRDDAGENELYLSTDFGATWIAKTGSHHCQYQFWFAHAIDVNPTNSNQLIMGGVDLYRYTSTSTTNGNGSRATLATNSSPVHADIHAIKFVPGSGTTAYIAHDGGMTKITNWNTTPVYTNINTGLSATQFYASIGASTTTANIFVGGLQDNGIWSYNGTTWTKRRGGDGGACIITPGNNNVVFASNDALTVNRSTGGVAGTYSTVLGSWAFVADDRTGFMAPIAISQSDPTRLYAASDNLHVSSNTGGTWTNASYSTANKYIEAQYKTAIALAVSPTNKDKLYVSTSPFSQKVDNTLNVNGSPGVFKCLNGGAATPTYTTIKTGLPDRFVMDFAIHPTDDNIVFVALGGYGSSHIYMSTDGGATWTNRGASGLLPDVPFNAVFIDPANTNFIYAGSDLGVYVSPDQGVNWYDFNNGLTDVVQVMDIQETADNQMLIATHGKGAWLSPKASGTLPVRIQSFVGEVLPASNKLEWKIDQEINVSRYDIERSADGNNFQKIGTVTATNAGTYNYIDASVTNSFYYRLKEIDNDGTYKYSDVVFLRRVAKKEFRVINNPFNNDIRIQFSIAQNSKGQINLYNAEGKLIRKESTNLSAGQFIYTMNNLSVLPAGAYFVEAIVNNQRWKEKLLKK